MRMNPQVQFRRQAVAPLVRPDSLDIIFYAEQILAVTIGPSHYHYQTHVVGSRPHYQWGLPGELRLGARGNLDLRIRSQRVHFINKVLRKKSRETSA